MSQRNKDHDEALQIIWREAAEQHARQKLIRRLDRRVNWIFFPIRLTKKHYKWELVAAFERNGQLPEVSWIQFAKEDSGLVATTNFQGHDLSICIDHFGKLRTFWRYGRPTPGCEVAGLPFRKKAEYGKVQKGDRS